MKGNQTIRQVLIIVLISGIIGIGVNVFRSNPISWLAQDLAYADSSLTVDDSQPVLAVTLDQARSMFDQGVKFVDAREPEYFNEGHIPGAWNFTSTLELAFALDTLQGKEASVVVYCDEDDCGSSEDLAYNLSELGFSKVYVFVGGWKQWLNSDLPVVIK